MNREHVYFHDGEAIVCLARSSGKQVWRTEPESKLQGSPRNWYDKSVKRLGGRLGKALPASFAPNLVLHEDVVLFSGGDGKLCGLDSRTGKQIWVGDCLASGHYSPEDVLVAGGVVWTTETAHGNSSGKVIGLDPKTGAVKKTIPCNVKTGWFHQRCYRSKATERFLLTARYGTEFVDIESGRWHPNHFVRGGCLYGVLPSNGLIYAPPHNCACFFEAKLFGFNALAPQRTPTKTNPSARLHKGPAYATAANLKNTGMPKDSWPVFRHDNQRSGSASTTLPDKLGEKWRVTLPARASQPVIASNRLLVAMPDRHMVICLAADTGKQQWQFTAGGRIDSPPTIVDGLCVFGSADGYVYCLTLNDGALAWRFRAAPNDQAMIAFGQLENVSPVMGSVLVRNGEVIFAAGRSMFLDDGLRMIRLDLRLGKLIAEHVMNTDDPEKPGTNIQYRKKGHNMSGGLPDILSCDDTCIYMRSQPFDFQGKRTTLDHVAASPDATGRHIFSPTGFLDDSWMHRSYWVYGKGFNHGAGGWPRAGQVVPAGRILCRDDQTIYGYGRERKYFTWSTPLEYHLFAVGSGATKTRKGKSSTKLNYRWSRGVKLHAKSMLIAGDKLVIAGPPVVINEAKAYIDPLSASVQRTLREHTEVLRGSRGGVLKVVAAATGADVLEMKLDYLPAFDGMAAAEGRLFIVSQDGTVQCYAAEDGN